MNSRQYLAQLVLDMSSVQAVMKNLRATHKLSAPGTRIQINQLELNSGVDANQRVRSAIEEAHTFSHGICSVVSNLLRYAEDSECQVINQVDDILVDVFKRYRKFSGNAAYPLPGGWNTYTRSTFKNKWIDGGYSDDRMEVLNDLINELHSIFAGE